MTKTNVKIYYCPEDHFISQLPKESISLSELLDEIDYESRQHTHKIIQNGEISDIPPKSIRKIKNMSISSAEFFRLSESGLNGFKSILSSMKISNIFAQNPPESILKIFKESKKYNLKIERYEYKAFNINHLEQFKKHFDDKILGQKNVKDALSRGLYKTAKGYNNKKPLTVLFYGPTGVGKTETAKFIAEIIGQELFRKQFSMYQNNSFSDYLFGASHTSSSFAKDLLDRQSNVILLDEFDKANNLFYSAFYQLFDEGIYSDRNYEVHLENGLIICTSNFLSVAHIKEVLGEPIYNRFDLVVEFSELSKEISEKIIQNRYATTINILDSSDRKIIDEFGKLERLMGYAQHLKNVRAIDKFIDEYIFQTILNHLE